MARSALNMFRQADVNTAALFANINNQMQRSMAAKSAANNQAIALSESIRRREHQDKEFKFKLLETLNNRRRQKLSDELEVAGFNNKVSLQNAELSAMRADKMRTRANAAALRGNLDTSTRLHQAADRIEESTFTNLENDHFSMADIVEGIDEGNEGLIGMIRELGIEPETLKNQPINELKGQKLDPVDDFLPVNPGEDQLEQEVQPDPRDRLNVIKGGEREYRPLRSFDDIRTQEDIDAWVTLSGVDPSSRAGQDAISRMIPKTSFGKKQAAEKEVARSSYLGQALGGRIKDVEAAVDEYANLGGSRPAFDAAQRIGEAYREANKKVLDASVEIANAKSRMQGAAFEAGLSPNQDPRKVDPRKIDAEGRRALNRGNQGQIEAQRAMVIAQQELARAEKDYLQFQITHGLMSEEEVQELRDAQSRIEQGAQSEESAEPQVSVTSSSGEFSVSDFVKGLRDRTRTNPTGLESLGDMQASFETGNATQRVLSFPSDAFRIVPDSRESIEFAGKMKLETLALNRVDELGVQVLSRFPNSTIEGPFNDPDPFMNTFNVWSIKFGDSDDEKREMAKAARDYIKSQVDTFNALSNSRKKELINKAHDLSFGQGSHKSSMEFSGSPGKNTAGRLLDSNGNLDMSKIDGGILEPATFLAALTEADKFQKDIKETKLGNVDFGAVSATVKGRGRQPAVIPTPFEEAGPPEPSPEQLSRELGVSSPETLMQLRFPSDGSKSDGAEEADVERVEAESTVPTQQAKKEIEDKTQAVRKNETEPLAAGRYQVIDKTRDQIDDFNNLRRAKNVISLDFNHDGKPTTSSRGLVVIPNDASSELVLAARRYVEGMKDAYGIPPAAGGKHGKGIRTRSENGRGKTRVTHLEGFFGNDPKVVNAIKKDPNKYANVIKDSFGRLDTAVFIPPHEQKRKGAATNDGVQETDFALKYVIPYLS